MLKLEINLYSRDDGYKKSYPVIIRSQNIIPKTKLPGFSDKMYNFRSQYHDAYAIESDEKVNTRFRYPYSTNYIDSGIAGSQMLYAKLNMWQRVKLRLINKDTFYHKNRLASTTLFVNILVGIANFIFAIINLNLQSDYSHKKSTSEQTRLLIQQSELLQQQVKAINKLYQIDSLKNQNTSIQTDTLEKKLP